MMTENIGKTLLQNTAEIVIAFDRTGRIYYGSPSAVEKLNCTRMDLTEHNIADFFIQEFQKKSEEEQVAFDVTVLQAKSETVMYSEQSTCFPVILHIYAMEEDAYLLLAEDVTWREDMKLKLEQSKEESAVNLKIRDEFTANVTHELRTPVNGIRGHAMSLLEQTDITEQKKILEIILYCCDNMSSIINNILDFSKMESDKFVLDEHEFDFYQMMDQIVATHMAEINKRELGMRVHVNNNVPQYIIGDSLRIGQILNNLLSNAVKFTKVGRITVDVTKTYQSKDIIELFFMVKDTGVGISSEDQDKLFQSFVQVDASTTRHFGGTGLGLFITKQLVEMMGGSIRLESEKGKGSCFSFNIRVYKGKDEHSEVRNSIQGSWNNLIGEEELADDEYAFSSSDNKKEIQKRMEKLVLSIELNSWEKAEIIINAIETLVDEIDEDLKRAILRLEMAIRKENYDKCMDAYGKIKDILDKKLN